MKSFSLALAVIVVTMLLGIGLSQSPPIGHNTALGGSHTSDLNDEQLAQLSKSVEENSRRLDAIEKAIGPLLGSKPSDKPSNTKRAQSTNEDNPAIEVVMTDKGFQASDWRRDIYQDLVWYDITYTSNLTKPARSVKGVLKFSDLFGEVKLQVKTTIDDLLRPGESVSESGSGFEFNQFLNNHRWVRDTSREDMIVTFEVTAVLYTDGTREDF